MKEMEEEGEVVGLFEKKVQMWIPWEIDEHEISMYTESEIDAKASAYNNRAWDLHPSPCYCKTILFSWIWHSQ